MTVNVWPEASGGIEVEGTEASNEGDTAYPATLTFEPGTEITLEAKAADGYQFSNWSSGIVSYDNPVTMVVSYDTFVTANFVRAKHTLTVEASSNGSITPPPGSYSYEEGSVIGLIAIPDSGWKFDNWSGGVADPSSPNTTLTIESDMSIAANFSPIMHNLVVNYSNGGKTTTSLGPYEYAEGTTVNVEAALQKGWRFTTWSGDVADPDALNTTIVMNSDQVVTANFVRSTPSAGVIGIAAGAVGAGLAAFFATRRKKPANETENST